MNGLCTAAGVCILTATLSEGGEEKGREQNRAGANQTRLFNSVCLYLFSFPKGFEERLSSCVLCGSQANRSSVLLPSLLWQSHPLLPVYLDLIFVVTVGFSASTFIVCPHYTLGLTCFCPWVIATSPDTSSFFLIQGSGCGNTISCFFQTCKLRTHPNRNLSTVNRDFIET